MNILLMVGIWICLMEQKRLVQWEVKMEVGGRNNWIKQGYITKDRVDDACRRIIVIKSNSWFSKW